jgi:lipoprotein-anchoring transpeptidase ErfK/SrfK
MLNIKDEKAKQALNKSKNALYSGDRKLARRWAQYAVALNPNTEEAWLILAALATPTSSLQYYLRVLQINPHNSYAQNGISRIKKSLPRNHSSSTDIRQADTKIPSISFYENKQTPALWIFFGLVGLSLLFLYVISHSMINIPSFKPVTTLASQAQINKLTRTPTQTNTFTPTSTPKPTRTLTSTSTTSPSNTPEPTQTQKPKTIKKPAAKKTPSLQIARRPKSVSKNEKWIDIDLSTQRAFALSGDTLQKSFIVSTGTWMHPTVTGTFSIYVKYHFANMSGPGYFLPNVPFVMYFYKDYGLHGTYWHKNFGTPMSHGCVNFRTKDAAWLFDFATIGTIVNIHK